MAPNFGTNTNCETTKLFPSITFFFFASNSIGTIYRAYSRRDYYTVGFVVFEYLAFLLLNLCLTAFHELPSRNRSKRRKFLQLAIWVLYSAMVFGFSTYFAPLFADPVYGYSLYVVSVLGSVFLFYVYVIWDDIECLGDQEKKVTKEVKVQVYFDDSVWEKGHVGRNQFSARKVPKVGILCGFRKGRAEDYADVLDSAKGWSASIRFNKPLLKQFEEFYERPDTFSLGVCNGCQLMALLGWVPGPKVGGVFGVGGDPSQPRFVHNESGRFECRFISVKIKDSPALMFKGMEGSTLGVWAAHGEGRAYFPDGGVLDRVLGSNLAPLRYCDDDGKPTEVYPFNLNGSPLGIAAICSPDGRHLALMPHPERCFLMWQFPWYPKHWNVDKKGPSPWLRMFQNAREWCS
ncbi:hypothetical protein RHGRI_022983 [Rhododendron griersonianum]|uniref:Phosphoribosylformylglycinamidine synthase n=1 Tax=Rhododendron griersonianum TaxID=479676 RepID=A0AAV6J1K6_9ERIC|nr:hypothetical protein RHGRI_022983 [Rhododendron griersonianum]